MRALNPLWRIYVFIVIASLAVTGAMVYIEWQNIKNEAHVELKYANNIFTHSLQSILHKNEVLLDILGNRLIELDPIKQPTKARRLINELLEKSPELAGFGLASPSGQLYLTSFNLDRKLLPNLLKSPKTAESFKQAMNSNRMVMGRTYYMKALKQWIIPIRYRITNNKGNVVAVMTTGLKFNTTKSIWSNKSLPKDMGTIIIRKDLYPQYVSNANISDYPKIYNHPVTEDDFNFLHNPDSGRIISDYKLNKEHHILDAHKTGNSIISTVSYNSIYNYYTFLFIPLNALFQKIILPTTWLISLLTLFNLSLYLVFRTSIASSTKSKRDMQAMFDHSPAVIFIRDNEGRFIFINHKFEQLHQVQRGNIIGKKAQNIFPANTADRMTFNDDTVIESGKTFEYEEEITLNDITYSYMSTKFPLLDNKGNIYAIAGISTDVTERKQQEELLRNSQKMEAMGKLTGGIAHDYNNMLSVILGYSDLLKYHLNEQDEQYRYVNEIEHAAKRGAKLTSKLLSFTRSKSTDNEILNLNTLLQDEQDMLEKTLTARIKLKYDLEKDLWPVLIDSSDMEDATLNMTINAMHAINDNGQITIQTKNQHLNEHNAKQIGLKKGDYSTISISDTGCGMDDKTQEKIFDPFYSTKGTKGTGLGLSQVYGFVQRSGGKITVYSEAGQGTQFILYFPRYSGDNHVEQVEKNPNKINVKGNETILLVDDEASLLELTAEMLKQEGYNTLCANDGKEALEILKENTVHLMVSDIVMPNMDGFQLAKAVKENYPSVKIQLMSGYADDYDSENVEDKLKQNLLTKPFSQYTLLKRIRRLIDNKPL